jgi:hypothetical protein
MADNVFINGRAAVHAGSAGKSIAFPDVCLCPPPAPIGPIPTPLVNLAQAPDLAGCAATVTIEGNRIAHAQSYVAKSTGDEVATSTGGGIITQVTQGKAYFQTFSMNVMIENQPAVRHLDLLTHNHKSKMPGNTPPTPWMSTMLASPGPAPKVVERQEREGKDFIVLVFSDELGRPVVGLSLMLETPGKKTLRLRTPAGGQVTVRGLKNGSCQLTVLDWQRKPMKEVKAKTFAPAPDGAPASLPTGRKHELICQIATMTVEVAHPRPGQQRFPKLVLESSDGKYRQQRTAHDNLLREAMRVKVRFDYLPKGARFTLTRCDGPSLKQVVFEDKSFDDVVDRATDNTGEP